MPQFARIRASFAPFRRAPVRWLLFPAVILALGALFLILEWHSEIREADPDRYYHLALSRQIAEGDELVPRAIPAIEGLGWHRSFPDKEFLFHQLTGLGYRLGGEAGAALAISLLAIAIYALLFRFAARRLRPLSALVVLLVVFCTPILLFRLFLLRPHVLALAAFTWLLAACWERRRAQIFLASLTFALGYHAFYVPLIALSLVCGLGAATERSRAVAYIKDALSGVAGVALGVVVNPYFPGSLGPAWLMAKLPFLLGGELIQVRFASELYPLELAEFGRRFAVVIIFQLFATGLWLRGLVPRAQRWFFVSAWALTGAFLLLSAKSPRAGEYAVVCTGFLLTAILSVARPGRSVSFVLVVLMLGHLLHTSVRSYRNEIWAADSARPDRYLEAVRAIPASDRGARVFQCEWDHSPYLLYVRPDLRFLDILDPSFLHAQNPSLFARRERLLNGDLSGAYDLIAREWGARYVFCSDPRVTAWLRADPRFRVLYPPGAAPAGVFPQTFERLH